METSASYVLFACRCIRCAGDTGAIRRAALPQLACLATLELSFFLRVTSPHVLSVTCTAAGWKSHVRHNGHERKNSLLSAVNVQNSKQGQMKTETRKRKKKCQSFEWCRTRLLSCREKQGAKVSYCCAAHSSDSDRSAVLGHEAEGTTQTWRRWHFWREAPRSDRRDSPRGCSL